MEIVDDESLNIEWKITSFGSPSSSHDSDYITYTRLWLIIFFYSRDYDLKKEHPIFTQHETNKYIRM